MTDRSARPARRLALVFALLGLLLVAAGQVRAAQPRVVVVPATGIVDQVMAGYLEDRIRDAADAGATAVIIELDTPGGSLDATRDIVGTLLDPALPVTVWVAPSGAQAASAGTFITMAANLAYMAPGTNIGAASPVGGQGEDIEGTLGEKVKNDAVAFITSIAEERDRAVDPAVKAVLDASSYTASQAVELDLVDGIAADLSAVLTAMDGQVVEIEGAPHTIETTDAAIEETSMGPLESLLHLLADPNIAFILFMVGFYGLIFELQNPNFVTGILGALAIILAFIGFGSLPLNVGGLLLIGLAGILFILELTVTSHGLLTIGGLVCLALGAAALYTDSGSPTAPVVEVGLPTTIAVVASTGLFMALVVVVAVRSRRMQGSPGTVGMALPAGTVGEVRDPLAPIGTVYAAGEEWSARAADERALQRGTAVHVIRQDGLTLIVEPTDGAAGA
ncbi:MAG: nodulation protein NfeD [Candidatus Limnocylindrales bacterium]